MTFRDFDHFDILPHRYFDTLSDFNLGVHAIGFHVRVACLEEFELDY